MWRDDDRSALWASLHPDRVPLATRLHIDQVNLLHLLGHHYRQTHAKMRTPPFEPVYRYEGDPWGDDGAVELAPAGGAVLMTVDEAEAWMAGKRARWAAQSTA